MYKYFTKHFAGPPAPALAPSLVLRALHRTQQTQSLPLEKREREREIERDETRGEKKRKEKQESGRR